MRVLKWIVERANGKALGHESALGWVPSYEDLDWRGLPSFTREHFDQVMAIDSSQWKRELLSHEELFVELFDRLPAELHAVRNLIISSLWRMREDWEHGHPTVGS
jgi:phosphoenolpyruvate carboxykinase (GTP)